MISDSKLATSLYEHESLITTMRQTLGFDPNHTMPVNIGDVAPTSSARFLDWLETEYSASKSTLNALGYDTAQDFPECQEVSDVMSCDVAEWLIDRGLQGSQDELIIAPTWPLSNIESNAGLLDLTQRHDALGLNDPMVIESRIRNVYTRTGATPLRWRVGVLLGDTIDPLQPNHPANKYREPGLVYTDLNVKEQVAILTDEKISLSFDNGIGIGAVTMADMLAADARRRLHGRPLLNRRVFTRILEQGPVLQEGVVIVPRVGSIGLKVHLSDSIASLAHANHGIRRILQLPILDAVMRELIYGS